MARSSADRLTLLESKRDAAEAALTAGAPINAYSLDGQTTSKESLMEYLDFLDARIASVRALTGTGFAGRKNLVRFTNG